MNLTYEKREVFRLPNGTELCYFDKKTKYIVFHKAINILNSKETLDLIDWLFERTKEMK